MVSHPARPPWGVERAAPVEGMLEAAVLVLLAERPTHGYRMLPELEQLVAGRVHSGRLYETLSFLERGGCVVSEDQPGTVGPGRRRYALTPRGLTRLHRWALALTASEVRLARLVERLWVHTRRDEGEATMCNCHCGPRSIERPERAEEVVAKELTIEDRLATIEALLRERLAPSAS